MPTASPPVADTIGRRSVVPPAAGRSLWRAAAWTGGIAAVVCGVVAIAVVAVCWLPASGPSGNATSAVRAGVLTFLAGLHGGVTVDGLSSAFVPLGLTVLIGLVAWRAGAGLADVAYDLDERRPGVLLRAGAAQAAAFAVVCGVAAEFGGLGTSSVSVVRAVVAALLLFGVTGSVAFVRWSVLGDDLADALPAWAAPASRAAAVGVIAYLGAGAVLVAGSVLAHRDRVEALSAQVGGGWSGLPILLLGVLAAPNATIAGAAYLAGPGFGLGAGDHVWLFGATRGVLPAFPLLGAAPDGTGVAWGVWLLASLAALVAGGCVARVVAVARGAALARLRLVGIAAALAAGVGVVLGWQAGGGIGAGRLAAFGPSPWQLGLALGALCGVGGTCCLSIAALYQLVRARRGPAVEATTGPAAVLRTALAAAASTLAERHADADTDTDTDADTDLAAAADPAADTEATVDEDFETADVETTHVETEAAPGQRSA